MEVLTARLKTKSAAASHVSGLRLPPPLLALPLHLTHFTPSKLKNPYLFYGEKLAVTERLNADLKSAGDASGQVVFAILPRKRKSARLAETLLIAPTKEQTVLNCASAVAKPVEERGGSNASALRNNSACVRSSLLVPSILPSNWGRGWSGRRNFFKTDKCLEVVV